MRQPFCFDCRFFVPVGEVHNELTEDQWDECLEGECRAQPPSLGEPRKERPGDLLRHLGEWPQVLASDWCGRFVAARVAPRSRTFVQYRLTERGGKEG